MPDDIAPRILIVEDEPEVSRVVAEMVRHLGYQADECNHAEIALDHVVSHAVDLMLVDYRLPELTGLDLIRILREQKWTGPVIMMTGYSETESRVYSEKLKEFTILRKPIALPMLATAIETVLRPIPEVAS